MVDVSILKLHTGIQLSAIKVQIQMVRDEGSISNMAFSLSAKATRSRFISTAVTSPGFFTGGGGGCANPRENCDLEVGETRIRKFEYTRILLYSHSGGGEGLNSFVE